MISTNIAEVVGVLNGMVSRMRDTSPVMARIGEHQASKVLLEIMSDKRDPDEEKWEPWRPYTLKQRIKKGNVPLGLLWDTGTLLESIKMQATRGGVSIGTNVPYAPELQYGRSGGSSGPPMVPRPFLGWSDEDAFYAENLIALHIEGLGNAR